jgi:hypothetical protein
MEARYGDILAIAKEPVEELADEGEVIPLRQALG